MTNDIEALLADWGGVTESYFFYNNTVELRYDPKDHIYLLVDGGQLTPQDGVTDTCHIIDKSNALIPWGCKQMALKILRNAPSTDPIVLSKEVFEQLIQDGKSAHKEVLEDAADVGKVAHAWIEDHIKLWLANAATLQSFSQPLPEEPRAANCCKAALDWMQKHSVKWVCTERKIYSKAYKYAGTADGLAYVSSCNNPLCCPHAFADRLSLIDWKSSNYLYIEYLFQTAAYQCAIMEEDGVEIKDRWVIRLGKEDGEFDPWHLEGYDRYFEDLQAFLHCLNLKRAVKAVEQRVKSVKDQIKAVKKAEAKALKEAQLAIKCKGADKYKGIKPPKCNGGNPCEMCREKYAANH